MAVPFVDKSPRSESRVSDGARDASTRMRSDGTVFSRAGACNAVREASSAAAMSAAAFAEVLAWASPCTSAGSASGFDRWHPPISSSPISNEAGRMITWVVRPQPAEKLAFP